MDVRLISLADVIASCRGERHAYERTNAGSSPACVELFRRAFDGDQDAWTAIWTTFRPTVVAWASYSGLDTEDVVQEGLIDFMRGAPKVPHLVAGSDLALVLGYLKTCVKRAAIHVYRKNGSQRLIKQTSIDGVPQLIAPQQVDLAAAQDDLLNRILDHVRTVTDDIEFLVFRCRIILMMKPDEIFERYRDQFADMSELRNLIQRLTRRLSNDPVIQEQLDRISPARQKSLPRSSHEIRACDEAKESAGMDADCVLDESLLLDYLTGVATIEVRRAVEQSPACRAAAERLARVVLPLLQLYRHTCPDADTLVAYQEQQLMGTDQLVVYVHVNECPHCQDELAMLAAIDQAPGESAPGLVRRVAEAIFQPPLAHGVRGTVLRFQTPQIAINVSTRKMAGQARTWSLRGELRTLDGDLFAGQLESALLEQIDRQDSEPSTYFGAVEPAGRFSFQHVPSGTYSLRVLTDSEELVIRRITIGDSS